MLPITLRPNGRRALIVGGGKVAARKAETLAEAGFPLFIVATSILDDGLRSLASQHAYAERPYDSDDVRDAAIAVAATDDDDLNACVVRDARAAGVLVCDASDPERGDFHTVATVRRGDFTLSVDSGGASPAFSKRIAAELAKTFGHEYGRAVRTLARMRSYVKSTLPPARRANLLRALAELPVAELASLNPVEAEHAVEETLERLKGSPPQPATAAVVAASRASALAMTQTRTVAAQLAARGIASTILPVTTTGDRRQDRAIERLDSVNVFVTELEQALRERRADYAVHSCKDLPSELAGDMRIAAISAREDPRDAFCSERYANFAALPPGSVVGTSSPRRRAQLAALRPDLVYEPLRGNVDTRLRKLRDGAYDAIVLAMAGLNRLRLRPAHAVAFEVDVLVPAVAQGALAAETRSDETDLARELYAAVNDASTEICVRCERAALRALRAGCSAPIGVYARFEGDVLVARMAYAAADDGAVLRERIEARVERLDDADALGAALASAIKRRVPRRVLLPRTQDRPSRIAKALRDAGIEVVELRAGDDRPGPAERSVDMVLFPSSGTVATALDYLAGLPRRPVVLAMGPESAQAARSAGYAPDAVAADASIEAFVALALERLAACP